MKNSIKQFLLIILPALCMLLAWPPSFLFPLVFVAFVPLFVLVNTEQKSIYRFLKIYLALLLWNIANTWWVYNASGTGSLIMFGVNSLIMYLPFGLYRLGKRNLNEQKALILFVFSWVAYEYLHHRWDLSWPWLTLGNSFAARPEIVQWYSVTGRLGGSFWILIVNTGIYLFLINKQRKTILYTSLAVIIPIIISLFMYLGFNVNKGTKKEIVSLQPSFDSWNEKFVRQSGDMLNECLQIADRKITDSTALLVMPETTLTDFINTENNVNGDYQIQMLRDYQKKHPDLEIIVGANMEKVFPKNIVKKPTRASRVYPQSGIWYEVYNSSLYLGKGDFLQFQHKSKLVPGAEQMPFIEIFPFIEKWAIKLDENSTTGTLGVSENPKSMGQQYKIGAPICYESNYGEYNGKYVNDGAGLLCVITNDGWWGNTPGHIQHMLYGRIIALEHRKWVVRSANTGISCIINSRGDVLQSLSWFKKDAIRGDVYFNNYRTFFTMHGDYLGRVSIMVILAFILVITIEYGRKRISGKR